MRSNVFPTTEIFNHARASLMQYYAGPVIYGLTSLVRPIVDNKATTIDWR